MGSTYTVAQGDCLSSIAFEKGFADAEAIWNDPHNADLRAKRKNPNILLPGDALYIPDLQVTKVPCAMNATHKFQVKLAKTLFRLWLKDDDGNAIASKPYRLKIAGEENVDGKTGGDGLVEKAIPSDATSGELLVWLTGPKGDEKTAVTFPLEIGSLDPEDDLTGAQARLSNLAFGDIAPTGTLDDDTRDALEHFQIAHGLDVTGELDAATAAKLRSAHDGT